MSYFDDFLDGSSANDHLFAGEGNDIVLFGADNLDGARNQDSLVGDVGADARQPYLFSGF